MAAKRCRVCQRRYTRAKFERLPLVGHRCFPANEDGPEEHYESRNCPCGATLVARVPGDHAGACRPQRDYR